MAIVDIELMVMVTEVIDAILLRVEVMEVMMEVLVVMALAIEIIVKSTYKGLLLHFSSRAPTYSCCLCRGGRFSLTGFTSFY